MWNTENIPGPIAFYFEILTGTEPLNRLHLVVDEEATAEFHTPVKGQERSAEGIAQIASIVEEHRQVLDGGMIAPVVKRFEPEEGDEPGSVELSMQAITRSDDNSEPPGVYAIEALYLLKKRRIYHITEFWSQRLAEHPH